MTDPLQSIQGWDFDFIKDTDEHTGRFTGFYVHTAAEFTSIVVNGSNVVATKGLDGEIIEPGTFLPFGNMNATAVTLASGKVIALKI